MKRIVFCILIMAFGVSLTLSLSVIGSPEAEAASASSVEAARQRMLEEDRKKAEEGRKKKEEDRKRAESRDAETLRKANENGFIAYSAKAMGWSEAKDFCKRNGGKLPRINSSDIWDRRDTPWRGVLIDGFGYGDRPWNELDLPGDVGYWTGTKSPKSEYGSDQFAWYIEPRSGRVYHDGIVPYSQYKRRVLCVP